MKKKTVRRINLAARIMNCKFLCGMGVPILQRNFVG